MGYGGETDRREFLKRAGSLGALSVLGPGAVRGSQRTSAPAPGLGTIRHLLPCLRLRLKWEPSGKRCAQRYRHCDD